MTGGVGPFASFSREALAQSWPSSLAMTCLPRAAALEEFWPASLGQSRALAARGSIGGMSWLV